MPLALDEPKTSLKIEEWIPLVKSVCGKFVKAGRQIEFSDEFSDGLIGLWQATINYHGIHAFSTFAHECIRNKILDGIKQRKVQHKQEEPLSSNIEVKSEVDFSALKKMLESNQEESEQERHDKEIIRRIFFDGDSPTKIAREMKCTPAYVCNCKRRGLDRLKIRIKNEQ